MNKLNQTFASGKAFIPFITGGDPDMETTEKLLYALSESGADAIEIGVPFSDPIAEGPVIEAASERALQAGCTVDLLFQLARQVRGKIETPLLFMTYYNPVFVYGVQRFTRECAACGVDGLIVPDLPFEERDELLAPCQSQGIELISLIAPTSQERIARIAQNSSGFLYCVSSLGVTGARGEIDGGARAMVAQAREAAPIPCAVGFGISTPAQALEVSRFADGVIIGSAIVSIVAAYGCNAIGPVREFAQQVKQAITF
ncbi:MAG: tryptophan synthase subunit alpha [Clostridiales bacterium]|nr:tryptophan synthase subunit alpha [Clostridiales bacterium]